MKHIFCLIELVGIIFLASWLWNLVTPNDYVWNWAWYVFPSQLCIYCISVFLLCRLLHVYIRDQR